MELRQSKETETLQYRETSAASDMATLTLRAPLSFTHSQTALWGGRSRVEVPGRPGAVQERIELPSIRQAIPEIHLRHQQPIGNTPECRPESTRYSPVSSSRTSAPASVDSNELSYSLKRRRLSNGHDTDEGGRPVQRLRLGPRLKPAELFQSPRSMSPVNQGNEGHGNWTRSHTYPQQHSHSTMAEAQAQCLPRAGWRPSLPSLPSLSSLPIAPESTPQARRNDWSEYSLETPHPVRHPYTQPSTSFEPRAHQASYHYGTQQPEGNPLSPHPQLVTHRTPFRINHARLGQHSYGIEINEIASDGKQRKRRGNLPKETTDQLRSWFVSHLQHPYPTEDEKQELKDKTGLQMNQITNWFINARRRQLPAMINNAQADADGASIKSGEGDGRAVESPSARTSPGDDSDFDISPVERCGGSGSHRKRPPIESI